MSQANVTIDPADWRRELVALLSSPDQAGWERARALRDAHLPTRLYRYRAPTDRSFETLTRGTIWLSAASEFNDLHDTSVTAANLVEELGPMLRRSLAEGQFNALPEDAVRRLEQSQDIVSTLDEIFAEGIGREAGPEAGERAREFFRNFAGHHLAVPMTRQYTTLFQRLTKVGCFCEAHDVPLLWAHYADSHLGFCVEYPIDALPADDLRRRWLWPVIYAEQRFDIVSFTQQHGGRPNIYAPVMAAIHKAPTWAYEREWRIVDQVGDDARGREMPMPAPSRIFLGNRMRPEFRERILLFARASGIAVLEMSPDTSGFALDAFPVT